MKVKITIGPMEPRLSTQLRGALPERQLVVLDAIHEGMVLAYLIGCASDRQFDSIGRKLIKRIGKMVQEKGASK